MKRNWTTILVLGCLGFVAGSALWRHDWGLFATAGAGVMLAMRLAARGL